MSASSPWMLTIVLSLLGLAAAAFTVFGGAFSTIACVEVPPNVGMWLPDRCRGS